MNQAPELERLRSSRAKGPSLRLVLLAALLIIILAAMGLVSISALRLMQRESARGQQDHARKLCEAGVQLDDAQVLSSWRAEGLIDGFLWRPGTPSKAVEGDLLLFTIEDLRADLQPSQVALESEEHRLVVVCQNKNGDELALELSHAAPDAHASSLQSLLLLHLLLVSLVAMVLGYWLLSRAIVRPLKRLVYATERLASGDWNAKSRLGGLGEIGELSTSFRKMVDAERRARGALEESLTSLETSNLALRASNHALEEAQSQLVRAERLASVGQLAAGVAHEIGNPLASTLAYLDLLGEEDLEPGEHEAFRGNAKDAARRIQIIIRELLDYSRSNAPETIIISPNLAIEKAIRLVKPQPRCREIVLENKLPALPAISMDEGKLTQLILNLLLNAADALQEVKGEKRITLGASIGEAHLKIWVQDNGPGIPEEVLPRIFDPFFTTKPPGEGTGLGLAICDRLAADLGAKLGATNKNGARLWLSFPLQDAPESLAQSEE